MLSCFLCFIFFTIKIEKINKKDISDRMSYGWSYQHTEARQEGSMKEVLLGRLTFDKADVFALLPLFLLGLERICIVFTEMTSQNVDNSVSLLL